jgi:chemotaxis protein histidine kinase CheA
MGRKWGSLRAVESNVHRHSGSGSATIRLVRSEDSVSLEIQDVGKGISPEKLVAIRAQRSGVQSQECASASDNSTVPSTFVPMAWASQ